MKIHIPKKISPGKRWYCGPHAFSVITGHDFETTRSKLNYIRGRPRNTGIRGYPTRALCEALRKERFAVKGLGVTYPRPRFKAWLKEGLNPDAFYLLELTQHFVVVKDGLFIDNHSGHCVSTMLCPHLQKTVRQVFEVTA